MKVNCGLYCITPRTESIPVPLKQVEVKADLYGLFTCVTIKQLYVNTSEKNLEVKYVFPKDDQAVIIDVTATFDDRTLKSKLEPKEKAEKTYNEAKAKGQVTGLVEQHTDDVLSAKIGNLGVNKSLSLSITYITLNKFFDGEYCFYLPTNVFPRYRPEKSEDSFPDIKYDTKENIEYKLSMLINCHLKTPILSVRSDTHTINTSLFGNFATVRFSNYDVSMDRDFTLAVKETNPSKVNFFAHYNKEAKETVLMISAIPFYQEQKEYEKSEYIFVIDRSGSMAGEPIKTAKYALDLAIRSLPANSYFNIVSFGTSYSSLFEVSKQYDEKTSAEAVRYVNDIQADMGGTELLAPVTTILTKPMIPDYLRQVFVLTDGEVTNQPEVISSVSKNLDKNTQRVFTLGIGTNVSRALVNGMAKAGRGTSRFAISNEKMTNAVMSLLNDAKQPNFIESEVNWNVAGVIQTPFDLRNVGSENGVVVYGLLRTMSLEEYFRANKQCEIVFTATDNKDLLHKYSVKLDPTNFEDQPLVGKLMANSMISDYQLDDTLRSRGLTRVDANMEIERISLAYQVLSSRTSFVFVDDKVPDVVIPTTFVEVPVVTAAMVAAACPAMFCSVACAVPAQMNKCALGFRSLPAISRQSATLSADRSDNEDCEECDMNVDRRNENVPNASIFGTLIASPNDSAIDRLMKVDLPIGINNQSLLYRDCAPTKKVEQMNNERIKELNESEKKSDAKRSGKVKEKLKKTIEKTKEQLTEVCKYSNIDGHFELTDDVLRSIGVKRTDVEELMKRVSVSDTKIVATVLVQVYLSTKVTAYFSEIRGIVKKINNWISQYGINGQVLTLTNEVRNMLSNV
jgi:hypothetical protein